MTLDDEINYDGLMVLCALEKTPPKIVHRAAFHKQILLIFRANYLYMIDNLQFEFTYNFLDLFFLSCCAL